MPASKTKRTKLQKRLAAAEYALMRYAIVPDEYLTQGIRDAVYAWRKLLTFQKKSPHSPIR